MARLPALRSAESGAGSPALNVSASLRSARGSHSPERRLSAHSERLLRQWRCCPLSCPLSPPLPTTTCLHTTTCLIPLRGCVCFATLAPVCLAGLPGLPWCAWTAPGTGSRPCLRQCGISETDSWYQPARLSWSPPAACDVRLPCQPSAAPHKTSMARFFQVLRVLWVRYVCLC
jgi:hypothetical protein